MVFFSFYCLLPLPASASSDFLFVLPRAPAFNHFQFDTNTNTNTNKIQIQIQIFKYLSYLDPFKSSSPGLRRGKRSGKRRQPILKLRSENSFLWNRKKPFNLILCILLRLAPITMIETSALLPWPKTSWTISLLANLSLLSLETSLCLDKAFWI